MLLFGCEGSVFSTWWETNPITAGCRLSWLPSCILEKHRSVVISSRVVTVLNWRREQSGRPPCNPRGAGKHEVVQRGCVVLRGSHSACLTRCYLLRWSNLGNLDKPDKVGTQSHSRHSWSRPWKSLLLVLISMTSFARSHNYLQQTIRPKQRGAVKSLWQVRTRGSFL